MPELRRRSHADAAAVVGWVVDADALYLFTGAQLRWPLRLDDLLAMDHVPGFAAWVLADGIHTAPLGHVDLTMVGTTVPSWDASSSTRTGVARGWRTCWSTGRSCRPDARARRGSGST